MRGDNFRRDDFVTNFVNKESNLFVFLLCEIFF